MVGPLILAGPLMAGYYDVPVVFVAGCEDGWVPLRRDDPAEWDEGEERRLFYVAMTRARRKLLVVGDSATLSGHPFYRRMIDYFESLDAYRTIWEEDAAEETRR